jgi:hypothetical protein
MSTCQDAAAIAPGDQETEGGRQKGDGIERLQRSPTTAGIEIEGAARENHNHCDLAQAVGLGNPRHDRWSVRGLSGG